MFCLLNKEKVLLSEKDLLKAAVDLSSRFQNGGNYTPFGAIVALDGVIIGQGISSVVEKHDVTAHAEVEALRAACNNLGNHLLPGSVVYCSGFPCPFCLMACRWAEVSKIVYAADLSASAAAGFEDRLFYEQLKSGPEAVIDVVQGDEENSQRASSLLLEWKKSVS